MYFFLSVQLFSKFISLITLYSHVAKERHNNTTQFNHEDEIEEDEEEAKKENPNDDHFYSQGGTSGDAGTKKQKRSSEERDFIKKFFLNMTREEARMYLSVSTVVFAVSLLLLVKSSS